MLKIPEQVKSLFNRDDIRKNIRITFPQSGRPDITNDNIAAETLNFTESVCSQSTFKYGLAEASVIEFETVGIANMLGETIEAWVEIDAATLPEELQTERDDLTYPVYPVPLGRFVVTACPRNHEAMAHRKVRAMSHFGINDIVSANDRAILQKYYPSNANTGLEFNKSFDEIAIDWGAEAEEQYITTRRSITAASARSSYDILGRLRHSSSQQVYVYKKSDGTPMTYNQNGARMQRIQYQDIKLLDYDSVLNQLADQIMALYGDTLEHEAEDGTWTPATRDDVKTEIDAIYGTNKMLFNWQLAFASSGTIIVGSDQYVYIPKPTEWVTLPTIRKGSNSAASLTSIAFINWSFSAFANATGEQELKTYEATGPNPGIIVQSYDKTLGQCDALQAQRFTIQTQPAGEIPGLPNTNYIAFPDLEIMQTAALAYLELTGTFGNFSRTGGTHIKALDTEPVMQLTRAQYESAWWDEYDLAPVGAIAYKIGSDDIVYQFGEGASVYKLNYDKIFETLKITSDQKINEILDVALVPELQKLMYTPVEIDAHGLPYIEAGDCIELEALDGTIIKSYVLRRQLNGIQYLTDQITADGITIAEVNV